MAHRTLVSPRRFTKARAARLHRMVVCAEQKESQPVMRRYYKRWLHWRRSYRGYWRIQVKRQPGVHRQLAGLRHCESTNNYRATNGSHWGAYQFADSTWARAQAWVPRRYRTYRASLASVDHQDAVTGRFYPVHTSEWECHA